MNAGPVQLPGVPFELVWDVVPEHWEPAVGSASRESGVLIEAGPQSDLFVSPDDVEPSLNAPRLIGVPDSRFQLSALVEVEFVSTFDAGVLLIWANERSWAKLCLEYSPAGQPMVVSVVTRGVSDDANSRDVEGLGTWLRISRSTPGSFAFHAATDGVHWSLIRHFSLDLEPDDLAEAASAQLVLDSLEQVVGFVRDLEVGVAGDPKQVIAENLHPRKERVEVLGDDVLEGDEDLLADLHEPG